MSGASQTTYSIATPTLLKCLAITCLLCPSIYAHAAVRDYDRTKQIEHRVNAPNVFGAPSIDAGQNPLAHKIKAVLNHTNEAQGDGVETGKTWADVISKARSLPRHKQIQFINLQVNSLITYRADRVGDKPVDIWSPAIETMQNAKGDCEDFSILKIWLLQQLGFDTKDLFIVAVHIPSRSMQHAITIVKHDDVKYVLDNMTNQVLSDQQVKDYIPLYSANTQGFWLHGTPVRSNAVAGR